MLPLISKPIEQFTPEEYHAHVTAMYGLRVKGGKKASAAPGITISKNKKGVLSIRKSKKRAFEYVLRTEIDALAKEKKFSISEVWTAFKIKGYIITETKAEAENINTNIKQLPI